MPAARNISERALITLIGAIQFVHIVDFMMVMPLGPDLALALGMRMENVGLIGGAYGAAAAISGIASAAFLDRFNRRSALVTALLGLTFGTLAGAFATSEATLLAARIAAGLCAGPLTALAIAVIADTVPPERRGRAIGAVMGAFSIAAVVGVPIGLELARLGGWQAPFFAVSLLTLLVGALAWFVLPPLGGHRDASQPPLRLIGLLTRKEARVAYPMTLLAVTAAFLIIPNLSTFVQFNLHYPREQLGLLYLVGGIVSFFALRIAGRLVDRVGAVRVAVAGTAILLIVLYAGFVGELTQMPVLLIFISFMLAQSVRNVAATTLTSQIPRAHERAGFMAVNTALQNLGAAIGATLSTWMLHAQPDGSLTGMSAVASLSMLLAATLPPLLWVLHRMAHVRH